MKASPMMAKIVTQLAEKHDLRLTQPGHIRLVLPHYDPLVIEVLQAPLIHVAHLYTPPSGVAQPDPGILFFTGYGPWLPVEVRQRVGGCRIYAALSPTLEDIESVWLAQQADLAGFAEVWAANLIGQGWLDDGVLHVESVPSSRKE